MTQSTMRRSWIAGLAAAAIAVLAPGIAQAEPPSNDDFDSATAITALPFQATENTAEATTAPDDPRSCDFFGRNSVWFRYTAADDAIVKVTATATGFRPVLAAYTGVRGNLSLVPGVCAFDSGNAETFHVTAGTTYHLLVVSDSGGGGALTLTVESAPPSPNDAFANAERVTGLPATATGDLARAGLEPNEPVPSCRDTAAQSVWYVYTPPTRRSVSATVLGLFSTVTVYRGDTLTTLSEVDCQVGRTAVFLAEVGATYYLRVATEAEDADRFTLDVRTAPALTPNVSISPKPASVFDDVLFFPFAGDSLGRRLVSGELRFGDGTSTPITGSDPVRHRYLADGVYQVEITASTDDGRTGSGTQTLDVVTHDVTVTGLVVPARARVDQTKPIAVSIANSRYDETVQVELLKKTGDFYTHIGTLTQFVPARADRVVVFPFAYTFSPEDAAAGSVTFKAVATFPFPAQDAHPVDNERLGTTAVR